MLRRGLIIFLFVLAQILVPLQAEALTPEKVLVGTKDQAGPTSNGVFLGWSQWDRGNERAYAARLGSRLPIHINARGTGGSMGTFEGSSNTLIYQQFRRRTSDLYFYDVVSKTRTKIAPPVNTSQWEYWPAASSRYILFARAGLRRDGTTAWRRIMLFDRVTSKLHSMTRRLKPRAFAAPSFAGDTYVSWTTCARRCDVWIWSEADGTVRLANPSSRDQYGGVIDETTGTLYYSRSSSTRCGRSGAIRRTVIGSVTSTLVTAIPNGDDLGISRSLVLNPDTGHLDLYFSRFRCRGEVQPSGRIQADIYVFRNVDT